MKRYALTVVVVLVAGCTSMMSPLMHKIIATQDFPLWTAQVESAGPDYAISWTSRLKGSAPLSHDSYATSATEIRSGDVAKWNWHVLASPQVARSSNELASSAVRLYQVSAPHAVHDWETGMQQLHDLTAYLLEQQPMPMDVTVALVPKRSDWNASEHLAATGHVPMRIAVPFSATDGVSTADSIERLQDLREALYAVGAQFQHVALAAGITAAPADPAARKIKDRANSLCWGLAVRPALAAGSPLRIKDGSGLGSSDKLSLFADYYRRYPEDPAALNFYALTLLAHNAQQYLDANDLDWPRSGTDLRGINGLLVFCRTFVHYDGDIRTAPLPVGGIGLGDYFKPSPAP